MIRTYTWRPDLPDHRDHVLHSAAKLLPDHVNLRAHMPPVEDQGNLGSCTANAIAGALEYLEIKAATEGPRKVVRANFFEVSRLFIYYGERALEHTIESDAGAMIRDGVKVCHQTGYCDESLWPYRVKQFAKRPSKAAFADAAGRKIAEYLRCSSLEACLESIAAGFPVVFGFSVYEDFESAAVAKTGRLELPARGEKLLGGHAVLMVGYDMPSRRAIVRNSWGPAWGDGGYFTMPFPYITNRNLSDDFWTIRR